MTTAQVVETSVTVNDNSPIQDYVNPDDQTQPTFINDLPKASRLTEFLLFADDTSIFFSHSNPNYLENVLNNELLNIDVWLRCNKLSVNIKKTNYVTF